VAVLVQGLWWLPAAGEAIGAAPIAGSAAAAVAAAGDAQLLRLAAAARMNTDVRRAVFCCVMGAEDAADAFERLLRLGLKVGPPCALCSAECQGRMRVRHQHPVYGICEGRLCSKTHCRLPSPWSHDSELYAMGLCSRG
jgi:nucleolar MIF4G domain-containing protein 1